MLARGEEREREREKERKVSLCRLYTTPTLTDLKAAKASVSLSHTSMEGVQLRNLALSERK